MHQSYRHSFFLECCGYEQHNAATVSHQQSHQDFRCFLANSHPVEAAAEVLDLNESLSRPASLSFTFRSSPVPLCVAGWGRTAPLYAFLRRGWFQTIALNGAQCQFPCHLFIQTRSLILISLQLFIQQNRKCTMCILSCKSQLVMNLYLKSLIKSPTLLFNDVCHGNSLLQAALHCQKKYNYV